MSAGGHARHNMSRPAPSAARQFPGFRLPHRRSRRLQTAREEPDQSSHRLRRSAPHRGQEVAGAENDVTGGIGVNDASTRIDKAHSRAEAVEYISEARSIRGPEIDKSADQHRPADVRNDKAHAPARFVVDNTIALVAKHPNIAALVTDLSSTAVTASTMPCGWTHSL